MSHNINLNQFKAPANSYVPSSQYNGLIDVVRSLVIVDSPDYRVTRHLGGTHLAINFPYIEDVVNQENAWPWKAYNTSTGSIGQIQINGDGFSATMNSLAANVNGEPNDTPLSGPPNVYPQLSITGNGVVYGYAVPAVPGAATLTSLDVYYAGTIPSLDTASPATYYPFLVASITSYTTDESGNVSFQVNNASNYGWTSLIYCNGDIQIY